MTPDEVEETLTGPQLPPPPCALSVRTVAYMCVSSKIK